MKENFQIFSQKMKNSQDYLKIDSLKNLYSYKIWARNAYVGVWIEDENAFLICRYKIGDYPLLRKEYHWDIGEPLGTAKPIEIIEKCPFDLKDYEDKIFLKYLDELEINYPVVVGFNTLQNRKDSAIQFQQMLSDKNNRE
ncbi:hypothetical protein OO007_13500 [Cocleimonas sp. KMM 6892]|uniref:hypothetical protein n=1 Tax=unclassified Cocleimonas TaxID=2639732 RepID=UPI002DBE484A|nr:MULTISPECIES: hypothetical protein [unclassified Cocleimonas]MEB8433248.1 hypothetical protein [Cocleimonas sp. KMM 6892]MEC4715771.1 hypothetical protein [Cocleimonas sp. KMM 6895]MEC4745232.1 hypothetical protein [Cocleimonas sp. KMM 6896]